ncbi:MAG: integrin alpha, partial [Anaerolineae bacterium]
MNMQRFLVLVLVVVGLMTSVTSANHTTAASSRPSALASDMMTTDVPVTIASLVSDWTYDGDQQGAQVGYAVGTAGDVNGDGYDDVIVGAPLYSDTTSNEGVAFVFYGSESGLSTDHDWKAGSGQQGARFGAAVGTAGDVNDDGYDDVIVGAYAYTKGQQGQSEEGRVYVFYGSVSGLSTTPDWILEGDQSQAHFGTSVGTAGDVNNDGYDDIIVGAPQHDNGETNEGRAYVFLGFEDGQTTTLFWSAEGDQAYALFGASVGMAGDVNDDGYGDVIVGAPRYDHDEKDEGAAFVFYGSDSIISGSWMTE